MFGEVDGKSVWVGIWLMEDEKAKPLPHHDLTPVNYEALLSTTYENGVTVQSMCKVNLQTGEVYGVMPAPGSDAQLDDAEGPAVSEHVTLHIDVYPEDERSNAERTGKPYFWFKN